MKTVIVAMLLAASSLNAETINIATGKTGGGYDAAAQTAAQKLRQRGNDVSVSNLNGSDEITLKICRGEAQVGLTQIDAIDARAAEGCTLRPVAVYGDGEIAVILFPPNSEFDEMDDLTDQQTVLVDTVGSGSSLFWDTIRRIENGPDGNKSDWSKAKTVNEPVSMAEALHSFGDIDAVIMVRTMNSADLSALLSRGWTLGELYDKDLNDYLFNDEPLYEPMKIRERVDGKKVKGYGYKVRSFVVVNNDVARNREMLSQIAGAFQ